MISVRRRREDQSAGRLAGRAESIQFSDSSGAKSRASPEIWPAATIDGDTWQATMKSALCSSGCSGFLAGLLPLTLLIGRTRGAAPPANGGGKSWRWPRAAGRASQERAQRKPAASQEQVGLPADLLLARVCCSHARTYYIV